VGSASSVTMLPTRHTSTSSGTHAVVAHSSASSSANALSSLAEVVVLLVTVSEHQPVWDGLDPERVVATAHGAFGGGGLGAAEVVPGDDEGDEDAVVAQKQGQLQRRVDVTGARVGHHHDVWLRHRRSCCLPL